MRTSKLRQENTCTRIRDGRGSWCGDCYTNCKGKTNLRGHSGYRSPPPPTWRYTESPMKRPDDSQQRSIDGAGFSDESWVKKYPLIVEHLVAAAFDDGTARELSSVTVSSSDGLLQLALNDKEMRRSLYTSAGTLVEALQLMERALGSGTCPWRPWQGRGKKK